MKDHSILWNGAEGGTISDKASPPAGEKNYEQIARAFQDEGVDRVFALMGDGNMHWATAMMHRPGVEVIRARHEHCACAMAIGYYSATGQPGVASTTCGPGFTQISTALVSAAKAHVPLVVFAGESPMHAMWHNQMIDQGPIAAAAGAHYIRAHSEKLFLDQVREAFYVARTKRSPVVLGFPYDLLGKPAAKSYAYVPSTAFLPKPVRRPADADEIAALAARLLAAERPIVLAGRGAVAAGCESALRDIAARSGALLATTLPGRGLFDDDPFTIGVSGGFATPTATELAADSDLVIAVGSSLSHHTLDNGRMFPRAHLAHIDERPSGLRDGLKLADTMIAGDARLAVGQLRDVVMMTPAVRTGYRTAETRARLETSFTGGPRQTLGAGLLDPRDVVETLDQTIPKDWDIVSGSGHSSYFYTNMRHRRPETFHVIREFGAIGNAISIAIGVAATKKNGRTVLLEGDGSLIMHIQELETVQRHRLKLLICVLNDGAYGAEIHKLRSEGCDDAGAIFGRPDFGAIARGFGLRGSTVADLGALPGLFAAYAEQPTSEIWDFPISDEVVSPRMANHTARAHAPH